MNIPQTKDGFTSLVWGFFIAESLQFASPAIP